MIKVFEIILCMYLKTISPDVGGAYICMFVSSTNKTDRHDITELLLKVALNIMKPLTSLCWEVA